MLLQPYPKASFCFLGAQTIDAKGHKEQRQLTQRFRIYMTIIRRIIGPETFTIFEYPSISGCFLINNAKYPDAEQGMEQVMADMLSRYEFQI